MNYKTKLFPGLINTILLGLINVAVAAPLSVGSFNVNANKATAIVIAKQMADHDDIDLWGLAESTDHWSAKIKQVLKKNGNFDVVLGTTGRDKNRLQIYFNNEKFQLISRVELDYINPNNAVRAPLVGRFLNKATNQEFLFMVNHLYRGNSEARLQQSKLINKWVEDQTLPVIAVGDYNFDMSPYDISQHGEGYDAIVKNNVLKWIQPEILLPTQCSKYQSILDFIFISSKVLYTAAHSKISYPETGYCSVANYSDHRPLTAYLDIQ